MDRPTSKTKGRKNFPHPEPGVQVQVWPPLLVMAIGLAIGAGLVYADWMPAIDRLSLLSVFGTVSGVGVLIWLIRKPTTGATRWFDVGVLFTCLAFGIFIAQQQKQDRATQPILPPTGKIVSVMGLVASDTITKPSGTTMTVRLLAVELLDHVHDARWQYLDTSVLVQTTIQRPKHHTNIGLGYGDTILIKAPIRRVVAAMYPRIGQGGFDYGQYLQRQGIYYQTKVEDGQYQVLEGHPAWYQIRAHLLRARARLQKGILNNLPTGNLSGLVLGLALGLRQGIDKATAEDFSITGTAHVLSVSGMHTMVFFNVLSGIAMLIGGSNKRHRGFWVWGCIMVLWLYVVVSGLSPAAIRAVAMTTVMLVGQSISRQTNMLNSLGLAVWVMLLIDPSLIVQPSFQLSVAGCVGLATLGQTWSALWRPDGLFLRLAWETGTITLAATIMTLPISMYHFGQVPLLFLPANILVGGLSSVLTIVSIALSVLGQVPILGWALAQVALVIGSIILWLVDTLATIPMSALKVSVGDMTLTVILGLATFALFQWWWHRQRWAGVVLLVLPLVWVGYAIADYYKPSQQGFWVWNQRGQVQTVSSIGDTLYWLGSTPESQLVASWQEAFPKSNIRVVPALGWAKAWWYCGKSYLLITDKAPRRSINKVNRKPAYPIPTGLLSYNNKPKFDVAIGQTSRLFGAMSQVDAQVWISKYPKVYLDTTNEVKPYYLSQEGAFEAQP